MAFHPRRTPEDTWKQGSTALTGICICCKEDVLPGADGYFDVRDKTIYLCMACHTEWFKGGGRLCDIQRFRIAPGVVWEFSTSNK